MKFVNYNCDFDHGFTFPDEAIRKAGEVCRKLEPTLTEKYGKISSTPLNNMQFKLAVLTNTLGELRGKTILDIGCGAKNSWDYRIGGPVNTERYYDPWLCRATHELGATVFGIDGASSPNEEYTHIQENMLHFEEIMKRFKDYSIDLACAWNFFDSPSLINKKTMFKQVVRGLERKVKPEGFFVFESIATGVFDKKDWETYLAEREKQGEKQ